MGEPPREGNEWMRAVGWIGDLVIIHDKQLQATLHGTYFPITRVTSGWFWHDDVGYSFELLFKWLREQRISVKRADASQ